MSSIDEIRNIKERINQAARKKCEADSVKSRHGMNDSIQSAVDRKIILDTDISNGKKSFALPSRTVLAAISILVFALSAYILFFNSIFPPKENEIRTYARLSDFKKAEKFVNSFLAEGKFTGKNFFKPGSPDSLYESAPKLLASYSGASASSVVVGDSEEGRVFKATCPMGENAAIIYLTPSSNRFYVSGIEIENKSAVK